MHILIKKQRKHAKDVQVRLGHSKIETTLQIYVHDTEAMAARSVELFEQAAQRKTS